jgi:hypothetical protein
MNSLRDMPPDSRAYRRELALALWTFTGGFLATAAVVAYALVKWIVPQERWWAIGTAAHLLFYPLFVGLAAAAAAVVILRRRHYRQGVYRCCQCGRILRGIGTPCICRPENGPDRNSFARARQHRRAARRRRTIKHVALAYVVLLPLALLGASCSRGRHFPPRLEDVVAGHIVLCACIALLGSFAHATLELLNSGRRFRLRTTMFLRTLCVWPAAGAFGLAFKGWLEGG